MDVDVEELGTILGMWAHPDDEAYLAAGLMAAAVDAGQHVAGVTATLGEAGETADPIRWPSRELRTIRRTELDRAMEVVGVADHACLDLPDGGLADLDSRAPVAQIAEVVDRVRPDTVVTFGPDGMTGHPDHRTVSAWATASLELTGHHATVLWATKTEDWVQAFVDLVREVFPAGLPPQSPVAQAWELVLDDDALARKLRALETHASQTSGLIDALGRSRYAESVRLEAFREASGPDA